METKYQAYYCFLSDSNPVILEREPENFRKLPYHYTTYCPNFEIAIMIYKTNLKIMKWRSTGSEDSIKLSG